MSVFKANPKYSRDERGLALPSAANDTFRSAQQKKRASASSRVITFDNKQRTKFLSGFSKRKQARRKLGYLQQLDAERQAKLESRRERRRELVDMVLKDRKDMFSDALVPEDYVAPEQDDDDDDVSVDGAARKKRKRNHGGGATASASERANVLQYDDDEATATVVVEPLGSVRNPVLELDAAINRSLLASKKNDERKKLQDEAKQKRKAAIQRRITTALKRKADKAKRKKLNVR